jgi:hypothetical protein
MNENKIFYLAAFVAPATAIPISALFNAGASLTPSPVIS